LFRKLFVVAKTQNKPIINFKSALYQLLNTTKPALAKSVLQKPAPAV
jgi:hypothetical protein